MSRSPRRPAARFISPTNAGTEPATPSARVTAASLPLGSKQAVEQVADRDPLSRLEPEQRLTRDRMVRGRDQALAEAAARGGRGTPSSTWSCWPSAASWSGFEEARRVPSRGVDEDPGGGRDLRRRGCALGRSAPPARARERQPPNDTAASAPRRRTACRSPRLNPRWRAPCTRSGTRSTHPFWGRSWVSRLGLSFSSLAIGTPSLCGNAAERVPRLDHVVLAASACCGSPGWPAARLRRCRRIHRSSPRPRPRARSRPRPARRRPGSSRPDSRLGLICGGLWLHVLPRRPGTKGGAERAERGWAAAL